LATTNRRNGDYKGVIFSSRHYVVINKQQKEIVMRKIVKISLITEMIMLGTILILIISQKQVPDIIMVMFFASIGVCIFTSLVMALKNDTELDKKNQSQNKHTKYKHQQIVPIISALFVLTVILSITIFR
jgi:ABC-type nickel/cobalt efflux system permease component RcnA